MADSKRNEALENDDDLEGEKEMPPSPWQKVQSSTAAYMTGEPRVTSFTNDVTKKTVDGCWDALAQVTKCQIFEYIGPGYYRFVGCVNRDFHTTYLQVHRNAPFCGKRTSKRTILSPSGCKLLLGEQHLSSEYRLRWLQEFAYLKWLAKASWMSSSGAPLFSNV